MNAYQMGYTAYIENKTFFENPFYNWTPEYHRWVNGYWDAEVDANWERFYECNNA